MLSLYEELAEKIKREPELKTRGGARADLGLMLYSRREEIAFLWKEASAYVSDLPAQDCPELRAALAALSPLFGERG